MSAAAHADRSANAPRIVSPTGLPAGTRVWNRSKRHPRFGTVMPHEPEHSRGCFPVRYDDGIWETADTTDVTAVSAEQETAFRRPRRLTVTAI